MNLKWAPCKKVNPLSRGMYYRVFFFNWPPLGASPGIFRGVKSKAPLVDKLFFVSMRYISKDIRENCYCTMYNGIK